MYLTYYIYCITKRAESLGIPGPARTRGGRLPGKIFSLDHHGNLQNIFDGRVSLRPMFSELGSKEALNMNASLGYFEVRLRTVVYAIVRASV